MSFHYKFADTSSQFDHRKHDFTNCGYNIFDLIHPELPMPQQERASTRSAFS